METLYVVVTSIHFTGERNHVNASCFTVEEHAFLFARGVRDTIKKDYETQIADEPDGYSVDVLKRVLNKTLDV